MDPRLVTAIIVVVGVPAVLVGYIWATEQVLRLFSDIKHEFGLTTIFVSHNLAVIREVSDEVAVMRQGEVVEQGTVDQIFDDPKHPYTRELLAAVPSPQITRRAG